MGMDLAHGAQVPLIPPIEPLAGSIPPVSASPSYAVNLSPEYDEADVFREERDSVPSQLFIDDWRDDEGGPEEETLPSSGGLESTHGFSAIALGLFAVVRYIFASLSSLWETKDPIAEPDKPWQHPFWTSGNSDPSAWDDDERQSREIPQYVFDYAPYIHLYSGENFWPCDMADHLIHTTPHLNYTPLQAQSDHPNLHNLNRLNRWGRDVFLHSDDNVEDRPEWLGGQANIPASPEQLRESEADNVGGWTEWARGESDGKPRMMPKSFEGKRDVGGRSDAPVVLVVINKPDGVVDAFWFFFYSYNLGNTVLNVRFGNHVGDWEHTMVRFEYGEPKYVFFSEHNFGQAWGFEAVEKIGKRPVGYSATGSHAMYATPGEHPYVFPGGLLKDVTDRGPLWDPALNVHSYTFDLNDWSLRASNFTPQAPIEWFYFRGHWGDKRYPTSDPRQYEFAGQYHYVTGPLGPIFKNLARRHVCQSPGTCNIRHWLTEDEKVSMSASPDEEDPEEYLP